MNRLKVTEAADDRLFRPVDNIFGLDKEERDIIQKYCSTAWKRSMACFEKIKNPNYSGDGICPYYAEQYVIYLYFLSNSIWKCISEMNDKTRITAQNLCDKIYMTSSMISGMDLYYGMDIPSNSIVFGQYPNVVIKENREDEILSMLHERFYM